MDAVQYSSLQEHALAEPERLTDSPPVTYNPPLPSFRPNRIIRRYTNRAHIKHKRLPPRGWFGFLVDGFTTIIDAHWYQIMLLFCAIYVSSWLFFGLVWWSVDEIYEAVDNSTCINNVHNFPSAFLYSLETQLTIGYGFRFISDQCSFGVFLLIIQSLMGLMIDSFLIGLVFAKLTKPSNRRQTILFSNSAVLFEEDGERYLEFRVADIRSSQLVEAHVRVTLYWFREGHSSDEKTLKTYDLQVGYETGEDRLILLMPVLVRHHITPNSPLYSITKENILFQDLEMVVALEAIVESTGLTLQALWSYTEREVMFDYCFKPMIYRQNIKDHSLEIDYGMLSEVTTCEESKRL